MNQKVEFDDLKSIDYGLKQLDKLRQKPILFIGSGLSKRYLNSPTWWELLVKLSELIGFDKTSLDKWPNNNYEEIAERLEAIYFTELNKELLLDVDNIKKPFRELIAGILTNLKMDCS